MSKYSYHTRMSFLIRSLNVCTKSLQLLLSFAVVCWGRGIGTPGANKLQAGEEVQPCGGVEQKWTEWRQWLRWEWERTWKQSWIIFCMIRWGGLGHSATESSKHMPQTVWPWLLTSVCLYHVSVKVTANHVKRVTGDLHCYELGGRSRAFLRLWNQQSLFGKLLARAACGL